MPREDANPELRMAPEELYREESFTDRKVGTIQRLTPVTPEGDPDRNRPVVYLGQSQLMTPAGALPLSFEIDASSLQEAIEKFGDHAQQAVEETMQRLQELRREAASSIAMPGSGQGGLGGAGGLPGGGGRGNIHMP
jgi:hypothetical protein